MKLVESSRETARPGCVDVSFLVATHNVVLYIEEALRSALAQRWCSFEILVVDDGSTDGTAEMVERMAQGEHRIRLFRRSYSGGASAARNRALSEAVGDWVAVLDGDDAILPERSAQMIGSADLFGAEVVADNLLQFGDGVPPGRTAMAVGRHPYHFFLEADRYVRANRVLGRGSNFGYLKPMFRRSFMATNGLRYDESLRIGEDFHICLRAMLAGGRFLVLSTPGYRYRVRPGSLSWRLGSADIETMATAFVRLRPDFESAVGGTAAAARSYVASLDRARMIVHMAESVQSGHLGPAARTLCRRPDTWAFVGSVLMKRLRRAFTRRIGRDPT